MPPSWAYWGSQQPGADNPPAAAHDLQVRVGAQHRDTRFRTGPQQRRIDGQHIVRAVVVRASIEQQVGLAGIGHQREIELGIDVGVLVRSEMQNPSPERCDPGVGALLQHGAGGLAAGPGCRHSCRPAGPSGVAPPAPERPGVVHWTAARRGGRPRAGAAGSRWLRDRASRRHARRPRDRRCSRRNWRQSRTAGRDGASKSCRSQGGSLRIDQTTQALLAQQRREIAQQAGHQTRTMQDEAGIELH